ncbi:hypothetical protein E2C01_070351 [Portunus trituberculatus]|uniref:Uncharacterized protein n=1 Tax=Portunus trituberculatus TaxID=210409 RepID=A0A5B7HTY2_PORTR|nr:hypothetical protein [Portunus trituberculatus]
MKNTNEKSGGKKENTNEESRGEVETSGGEVEISGGSGSEETTRGVQMRRTKGGAGLVDALVPELRRELRRYRGG